MALLLLKGSACRVAWPTPIPYQCSIGALPRSWIPLRCQGDACTWNTWSALCARSGSQHTHRPETDRQRGWMAHSYKKQTSTHVNYSAEQCTLDRTTFAVSSGGRQLTLVCEWVASTQQWGTLHTYILARIRTYNIHYWVLTYLKLCGYTIHI